MKRRFLVQSALLLAIALSGCKTTEEALLDANSLVLSAKEVREVFQGNTVSATSGDVFFFDRGGAVAGSGSYGGKVKGNWNITDDGRLCVSNLNASIPGGCYKVYFDNSSQQRKVVDQNGDLKWVIMNVVTGNPNNF